MKLIIEIPEIEYKQNRYYYDNVHHTIPLDDVKAEIKTFTITEKSEYDTGFNDAVLKCFNVLDNIGKVDFPQAEDIEPTVKGFVDTMDILDRICEGRKDE